jgi:hypothetical protein
VDTEVNLFFLKWDTIVSGLDQGIIFSVADPDPGSGIGCFLTPGSGIRDPE